jgi:hypothetical protein
MGTRQKWGNVQDANIGGPVLRIPKRRERRAGQRRFPYLKTGAYLLVVTFLALGLAIQVILGERTWGDLWSVFVSFIG